MALCRQQKSIKGEITMTNREQILSMIGDELIASNLIECRKYYKTTEELHSGKYKVVYIFNEKIYDNQGDAFNAVKKWLDEEAKPCKRHKLDDDINCGTILIPRIDKES